MGDVERVCVTGGEGCWVYGVGCRVGVKGVNCRLYGVGFGVSGVEYRLQGLGCEV